MCLKWRQFSREYYWNGDCGERPGYKLILWLTVMILNLEGNFIPWYFISPPFCLRKKLGLHWCHLLTPSWPSYLIWSNELIAYNGGPLIGFHGLENSHNYLKGLGYCTFYILQTKNTGEEIQILCIIDLWKRGHFTLKR